MLFVFLVAIGLPLLAGGRGGLGVFASPTGGFVIGFPFAALATGFVTERLRAAPVGIAAGIGAILGGIVVLYGFGILGLSIVLGKTLFEATGLVAVFIAGDVAKAIIAGIITAALAKARPDSVLSRT